MQLSQMSPEEAAAQIAKSDKIHRHGVDTDVRYEERVKEVTECIAKIIQFARNAKIVSTDTRANRGRKSGNIESHAYPGVYAHQTVTLSDGSHKYELCHPDYIARPEYGQSHSKPEDLELGWGMFGLWKLKDVSIGTIAKYRILKAAPQIYDLYKEATRIRGEFTQEVAERVCAEYVTKTQSKARAGIIKKMGAFLAECNLKDEDPEFLLQIMKFISRDNFWEMKNFFNYCRRNVGDINFLTPEEIIQAQNLAKAIEVQKS